MSTTGRYRIQSVAEMTGVSAATLRAWERRYGLPAPRRSSSAYRLYSDRDVERIRRVRELCEAGMAPSEAARSVLATDEESAEAARVEADNDELAVQRIVDAVDHFDPDRIEAAVKSSLFLGPAVTLFERVFRPALIQIGERWATGQVSVAQEHLAAEILGNTMRFLLRLVQPERARRQIVLACFADEEHTGPLYGVGLRLATWSIKSIVLGARTPPDAVRHMIDELRPDLVGLSATITPSHERALALLDGYADACGPTPWIVGGLASESMREPLVARGGHVAPTSKERLHELINTLCPLDSSAAD
ncbi:MerR family transcriptional regulator [Nannocystis radixulma]|uniref:MerR family transcriptional regulator n=1 Tax=Nannocystis radixulma TaxID=2995305 RepID=A0ABT5B3R8_9BACT|nr:MerR family transcriptional regulator [Nannocystis radixulma]MDC0668743.1 MerR family transcriptional regulator [Nannocystis radixulma]